MTFIQQQIPFPQDNLTQIYIAREENRKRAETNCERLLQYWQRENRHISKYDALDMGIDCLAQRVANLIKMGVPVESETRRDLKEPFARYYLKCTCDGGECYLHSKHLQL